MANAINKLTRRVALTAVENSSRRRPSIEGKNMSAKVITDRVNASSKKHNENQKPQLFKEKC